MEFSKQVFFKNWTATDFTYKYAGEDHTFKAGSTYSMAADIAVHFAQHLAERELFASGSEKDQALPEAKMTEMMGKCFPGGGIEALTSPLVFEEVTEATPAPAPEAVAEPPEEEGVEDKKPPKFKGGRRPKTKDSEYTK